MIIKLKKIFVYLLFTVTFTLFSCGMDSENISHLGLNSFNFQPNKLNLNDSIRILYLSSYKDENENDKYLIQVVAQQLATGDTVNILTFNVLHIEQNDGDRVFHYKPFSEVIQQRIETAVVRLQYYVDNFEIIPPEQYHNFLQSDTMLMVTMDGRFEKIGKTTYPTVLGNIR